jgi:hypothetical protein
MPTDQINRSMVTIPRKLTAAASHGFPGSKDTGSPAPTRTYPLTDMSDNTPPRPSIPAAPLPESWDATR